MTKYIYCQQDIFCGLQYNREKLKYQMVSPFSYHVRTPTELNETLSIHARSKDLPKMTEKQRELGIRFPVMVKGCWRKQHGSVA